MTLLCSSMDVKGVLFILLNTIILTKPIGIRLKQLQT